MVNTTLQNVAKHSLLYGYVLSQPFSTYVDEFAENKTLMDIEQLSYGEHSDSVRALEKKLSSVNVYADSKNGYYGIVTESAIKTFQKQQQRLKKGIIDGVTIEQLEEMEEERQVEKIKQLAHSIEPGMHNEDVEIVQTALAYFGYYEWEIDGIYGPITKQALEKAEVVHDLDLNIDVTVEVAEERKEQPAEQSEVKKEIVEDVEQVSAPPKQVETSTPNGDIVQIANAYIGTPYAWGGTSPGGFDCSGFLQFVYAEDDKTIPRTVSEIWNFSTPVDQPSVGDLVFFETYKAGPSHAGIYVGDGKFIHAGESRGVEISDLDQDYWKQRYLGAQRIE